MCVVSWGWDRDAPGAPDIRVAQLIGELLELVCVEMIVIPQNVVVTRAGGSLDTCTKISVKVAVSMESLRQTLVRAEIKVKFGGMSYSNVYGGSCWNIPTLSALLFLVSAE